MNYDIEYIYIEENFTRLYILYLFLQLLFKILNMHVHELLLYRR